MQNGEFKVYSCLVELTIKYKFIASVTYHTFVMSPVFFFHPFVYLFTGVNTKEEEKGKENEENGKEKEKENGKEKGRKNGWVNERKRRKKGRGKMKEKGKR